jgi:hypothetical protein
LPASFQVSKMSCRSCLLLLLQVCDQELLCGHLRSMAAEATERQAVLQARLGR